MTDRPILFSAPMVRALLAGRKTQTRRVIKGVPEQPVADCHPNHEWLHPAPYLDAYCSQKRTTTNPRGMSTEWCWWQVDDRQCLPTFKVAYRPGDRLWVREEWKTTALYDQMAPRDLPSSAPIYYTAGDRMWPVARYRASMHMPRWASRLTLYVTDVRVQRLQDISEADADAERFGGDFPDKVMPDVFPPRDGNGWGDLSIVQCYAHLWDHINGPGSWAQNPWVAAYTFTVRLGNIDTLPATLEEAA
jgi:hypothetical protein